MATMVGTESGLIDFVNNLIELNFDAVGAYKTAIERLDDVNARSKLEGFLGDHQRHIEELSAFLREIHQEPAKEGDLKQVLTQGKVVLSGLLGDRSVLEAMKSNEMDINRGYERAIERPELPDHLRALLKKQLMDEERHRSWFVQQLNESAATVTE